MSPCHAPISWDALVGYWAKETSPQDLDALELHLMSCAECSETSARVAAITEAFRGMIPAVIDSARLAEILFPRGVDIVLHRLGGLDLKNARAVRMRVLREGTGDTLLDLEDVPFDRDRGELLVACQQHFSEFPHDVLFEVLAQQRSGAVEHVRYPVPHRFES